MPDEFLSARVSLTVWRLVPLATALVCLPAIADAQHATGSAVTGAQYDGCTLCHGSHPIQSDGYALRSGDLGGIATAPGLGTASRSCLRCHSTASERVRQPEFSSAPVASVGGKFLQFDLSNDHPLGRVGSASILDEGSGLEDPVRGLGGSVVLSGGFYDFAQIECTLCHDPHEEYSIIPGPEEQKVLCGSCHDPATYAFESHTSLACGNCHSLHGGYTGDLLAEPTSTVLCQSCHETGGVSSFFSVRSGTSAAVALPPAPRGHARPPDGECTSCHRLHE